MIEAGHLVDLRGLHLLQLLLLEELVGGLEHLGPLLGLEVMLCLHRGLVVASGHEGGSRGRPQWVLAVLWVLAVQRVQGSGVRH